MPVDRATHQSPQAGGRDLDAVTTAIVDWLNDEASGNADGLTSRDFLNAGGFRWKPRPFALRLLAA